MKLLLVQVNWTFPQLQVDYNYCGLTNETCSSNAQTCLFNPLEIMKYLTITNDETWSKTKYKYVKDRIAYGEIFMGMFSEIFYGTQLTLCDVPGCAWTCCNSQYGHEF